MTHHSLQFIQVVVGAALVAGSASVLAETPAQAAGSQAEQTSVQVQFRADELNSGPGAENVYWKLRRAAATACGDDGSFIRELRLQQQVRECENSAVADAVARIDHPMLTALYDSHTPGHPVRVRQASAAQSDQG